jgi:hypothetical protein
VLTPFPSQDNLTSRVPDDRKDQLRGHRDRAHEFLTEEYFPEERRDQFIYRMKKVRELVATFTCSR